jgi:hypothetical protein
MTTATQIAAAVTALTPANVMKVYSGKDGACCCGCKGTYRVSSLHRAAADAARGYAHDDKDVNDKQVAKVLGIFQANLPQVEVVAEGHFVHAPPGPKGCLIPGNLFSEGRRR